MFSAELKKGSSEMLILSLLEARARHGYEIGKLIEARSGGKLTFALPTLYPTLLRLENRGWIRGRWVEKPGERRRCFYRLDTEGTPRPGRAAQDVGVLYRRGQGCHGHRRCVSGKTTSAPICRCPISPARARRASSASSRRSSKTSIARPSRAA